MSCAWLAQIKRRPNHPTLSVQLLPIRRASRSCAYLCTGTHQIAMSAIATGTESSTFQAHSLFSAHFPLFGLCTTETSIQEIGTLPP